MDPARSVDELVAVLRLGAERGEASEGTDAVSQLEHSLQCAALLAAAHAEDLELQAAGLLHDIGHSLVPGDVEGHGRHGRAYVEPLLGGRVGALVELHVLAKRWLVTVEPSYRSLLSAGSTTTLVAQGEAMSGHERTAFESDPHHRAAVALRRADEAAKVAGATVEPIERWIPVLDAVAGSYATG